MSQMNVIRQDIVQIGFEVENSPFADILKQEGKLAGMLDGAISDIKGFVTGTNKAEKSLTGMIQVGKKSRHMGLDSAADDALDLGKSAGKAEKSMKGLASLTFTEMLRSLSDAEKKMDGMANASENLAERVKSFGGAALGAIGVGLGVKESIDITGDYQRSVNTLQTQSGASDIEMPELSGMVTDLYKDNMGESFEDVARSIATVKSITGQGGDALQGMTNNALLMRDAFEFDVTESVRAADMMMRQFGVSGDQAYSMIAQGAQNGLDKNGDLLDSVNEYSVHFKGLGFSAEEMMNMMANGAKSGTFSVDRLGDSIKEFGIRAKESNDATKSAFYDLGLNAEKVADDFAHGGAAGKAAFNEVTKRLAQMKDPLQQNAAGVALFGTMWEDLQAEGVLALSKVTGGITDSTEALEKINDIQYNDISSALGSLGRTAQTDLIIPLAQQALPAITTAVNNTKTAISEFGAGMRGEVGAAQTPLYELGQGFAVVGNMAGNVLGFITENAGLVIPVITGIVTVMGAWKLITLGVATVEGIKTAATLAGTVATKGATVAQWLFNGSLLGCPALLAVAGIAAVIAIIGGLIKAVKDFIKLGKAEKELSVTAETSGVETALAGIQNTAQLGMSMQVNPELGDTTGLEGAALNHAYDATPEQLAAYQMGGLKGGSSGGGTKATSAASQPKGATGKPANFGQDISGFQDSVMPENYAMGHLPTGTAAMQNLGTTAAAQTIQPAGAIAARDTTSGGETPEYTPEKTMQEITNNTTNNETFHFSPTIHVEVKGTGNDKDLEKKIIVVVNKKLREAYTTAQRKHPRIIEA